MEWQPIETAPKDGTKIDICAKHYLGYTDTFIYDRVTDSYWYKPSSLYAVEKEGWRNVPTDWCAVGWMPLPELPKEHKA